MESNIMAKPVGGRGQRAAKPTTMRRIPEGIKEAVEMLSDLYRDDEWDGTLEGLNLISGNKQKSYATDKPDIKNNEDELVELREWKRRAEVQLRELGDLRENVTQLQRANAQADGDLARAVARMCAYQDEAKKFKAERDELDKEVNRLHEQNGDLDLRVQELEAKLQQAGAETQPINLTDLNEIRDRILKDVRSDRLKAVTSALNKFVAELSAVDS